MSPRIWQSFFMLLLVGTTACQKKEPALPREKARELANVFYNRDLYKQAVAEMAA